MQIWHPKWLPEVEENQPPDHLAGAKTSEKGARASRAPLFLVFWVLPSGLAAALASFLAAISPAIFADFRAKLSAGQWQAVWQAKMAIELFSAHGTIKV